MATALASVSTHRATRRACRALTLGPPAEGRESPLISSGSPELDARLGGFPRGRITELLGPASAGKTSLALAALESTLRSGALAALIDPSRTIFPAESWATGRLLVIRPGNPEDALRALDALLSSAVFSLITFEASPFTRLLPEAITMRVARLARETGMTVISCGTQPVFGSSCALRLDFTVQPDGFVACVGKSRQGMQGEQIMLPRHGFVPDARRKAGAAFPRRVA